MRLKNFQCFGSEPTIVDFEAMTYLLGPNGAGKTTVLTALGRMFAIDPRMQRVGHSDFHVPYMAGGDAVPRSALLWIEADFEFPELAADTPSTSVPSFFPDMRVDKPGEMPRLRVRLTARRDDAGDISTELVFVNETDENDEPLLTTKLDRYEQGKIQVHYLPARRDPADHIAHTRSTLLGRLLHAVDWTKEQATTSELTRQLSDSLAANPAIASLGQQLAATWNNLHTGTFFTTPSVTFTGSDIDALLRYLNIAFDAAPDGGPVDWTRLSDGQQSLLYLTMVLALHDLGTQVLARNVSTVSPAKLRPAAFTLIALEEPENSLSPHYTGRVLETLRAFSRHPDAQVIVATHSPSVVRRVPAASIRHLRLDATRRTVVTTIQLPPESAEAYKFVREAVEAFPELYFARLVVLGEGDSEQIVLPRMLEAAGVSSDLTCISVVPLGGRHVNHFWRLLGSLGIPYLTILDLDTARFGGGWGRIRYAMEQLLQHPTGWAIQKGLSQSHLDKLPAWNDPGQLVNESDRGCELLRLLEEGGIFFSAPLDLDFSMLSAYPDAYGLMTDNVAPPDASILTAVLGKGRQLDAEQYTLEQSALFAEYHRMFNRGSKPVQHLTALSNLSDKDLLAAVPPVMSRLIDAAKSRLAELPE
jgi:putative ATP-dependent endonuclease of the OLD family